MPSRAERRRQAREGGPSRASRFPVPASPEVLGALFLGAVVVAVAGVALLLSGGGSGGGGSSDTATPSETGAATDTQHPTHSPSNTDEQAIAKLAQKSVEALPQDRWPALYDDFTAGFQARCPRDQFVQAGIDAAREQGDNLAKLAFVGLEQVSVEGDQANATVIGEIKGGPEYTVYAAFARENGTWKLSVAADTTGCQAFTRP